MMQCPPPHAYMWGDFTFKEGERNDVQEHSDEYVNHRQS